MERRSLAELILEASQAPQRRRYAGDPPESGGTSQKFPVAPGITWLAGQGAFEGAKTIIDYGAGKWARNALWLREQGYDVYAYDPYNGTAGADGWTDVTTDLPKGKFDVGFSAFVLNVVPEHVELGIIQGLSKIAKTRYHIVRNSDVFAAAKKGLFKGAQPMTDWFLTEFATEEEKQQLLSGQLTDETIMEFAQFGYITKTSRGVGFQRVPTCEDHGLTLIKGSKASAWKVYQD